MLLGLGTVSSPPEPQVPFAQQGGLSAEQPSSLQLQARPAVAEGAAAALLLLLALPQLPSAQHAGLSAEQPSSLQSQVAAVEGKTWAVGIEASIVRTTAGLRVSSMQEVSESASLQENCVAARSSLAGSASASGRERAWIMSVGGGRVGVLLVLRRR